MDALVIGNGESRKFLDLSCISRDFVTIGCNAIHRDFIPDHLICCDNRMVIEALSNAVPRIYTREKYYKDHRKIAKNKNIFRLPDLPYEGLQKQDQPVHWGSGPYAILLACTLHIDQINLIGFDLYGIDGKVNNVYKETTNYSKSNYQAVDYSYWVYQIAKIFEYYSNKEFIIYNSNDWKLPPKWNLKNVSFKNISDLFPLTLNTESV